MIDRTLAQLFKLAFELSSQQLIPLALLAQCCLQHSHVNQSLVDRQFTHIQIERNAIAPIAGTRMTQGIKGGGSMDYSPENKRLAPENVVPPVVYLASEQSEWLNRRVIFAGNGRISLMSNPVVEREIVSSSGTWDIPTAFTEIETSFKEAVLYPNIFDKPPAG